MRHTTCFEDSLILSGIAFVLFGIPLIGIAIIQTL
jgi:hypothetical protein